MGYSYAIEKVKKRIKCIAIPVIAVMALFYGVGYWNQWFYTAIFLRKRNLMPIQLVMHEILITKDQGTIAISTDDSNYIYRETIKYSAIII